MKLQQLINSINTGEPVLIYFSAENCSVCEVLRPKIKKVIKENFDKFSIHEIKSEVSKEINSYFTVFSVPTVLVFFDKKEFKRYGRNISLSLFIEELKRPYNLFYR